MSFRWVYEDADGAERGSSQEFESRQQAEDWMGAEWKALLDSGALKVRLMDDDRLVYRMALTAE